MKQKPPYKIHRHASRNTEDLEKFILAACEMEDRQGYTLASHSVFVTHYDPQLLQVSLVFKRN